MSIVLLAQELGQGLVAPAARNFETVLLLSAVGVRDGRELSDCFFQTTAQDPPRRLLVFSS